MQTLSANGASFSTFASHNPRIVQRSGECILNFTEIVGAERQVRFMRTGDGGRTFSTFDVLSAGPNDVRPAGMVLDHAGSLFAMYPEPNTGDQDDRRHWVCRRYDISNGYGAPVFESVVNYGGSSNFSVHYDPWRHTLYYATIIDSTAHERRSNFFVLDPRNGAVLSEHALTSSTNRSGFHYPYFSMWNGVLFLAWTSWACEENRYDGISIMRSDDGGGRWTTLEGLPHQLPIDGRPGGPAVQIVLEEDRSASTWLGNIICHRDMLHLFYRARFVSNPCQCYRRYNLLAKRWERDIRPRWGGAELELNGIDGFFLSSGETLFAVGNCSGSAVAVLASEDNGTSWEDFGLVQMPEGYYPYGLHGCLTPAGDIVGLVTASPAKAETGTYKVMSFRVATR